MREQIDKLLARIDAMAVRERVLLGAAVLVVLAALIDTLALAPGRKALAQTETRIEAAEQQRVQLDGQLAALRARLARDPDAEPRAELERLTARLTELDAELRERSLQLIGPGEMARVLQDLLSKNEGLTLVSVTNEPAEPANELIETESEAETDEDAKIPALYRHGIRIEFQGDYMSVVKYLETIEALTWRLFWDRIEVETLDYPQASIRLRAYTLSFAEGWIGV